MQIIKTINNKTPDIKNCAYVAENVFLSGDVQMGKDTTLWPGVVIRADIASVIIGDGTNIQDNSVIHVDFCEDADYTKNKKGHTIIGENTTVGHAAIIHACQIGNGCLIGMGSTILDDAIIEDGAMVAAGALVTSRTIVKSGQLWGGSPARYMRDLRESEIEHLKESAPSYVKLGKEYTIVD